MARPQTDDVFRAIADPTRRSVLGMLSRRDVTAGDLAAAFAISQPAVSQHLKVLRSVGLVEQTRMGRERYYRLRPRPLREVVDWLSHFERFWEHKLDALGAHLEQKHGKRRP